MLYLQLFAAFLKIGLFSFGGGYAILALIQKEVVQTNHWVTVSEYFDIVAISQMTPGPIAINAATYIGWKIGGWWGAVVASFGVVLPALILMTLITVFYLRLRQQAWFGKVIDSLKPVAAGMIATATLAAGNDAIRDWQTALAAGIAFCLIAFTRISPFTLLLLSGIAGAVFFH